MSRDEEEPEHLSLEGPVERIDGELALRIPLAAGGHELAPLIRRGSRIEGDFLIVAIPTDLAAHLRVTEGSLVVVDDRDNRFNITRSDSNDRPTH